MKNYKRVVVKIGSSSLTHKTGNLNIRRTEHLVKVLSDIKSSGIELIIVSSGAIAIGSGKLGFSEKPHDMATKQATAAVGQCELMYIYDKQFSEYNQIVAQILLTNDDIKDPKRCKNVENTLFRLIELGCIPIVNENDTVSVQEIEVGVFSENDALSAVVAKLLNADLLVIISDIDGLYDSDPRKNSGAKLIPVVEDPKSVKAFAEGASELGTGGMTTKLHAATLMQEAGIDMIIINGNSPENLYDAVAGKPVGTLFPSKNRHR
ncbi:MAG: glutamate 5-kinase [Ruminococcaceae bacterium]|nr:glutamate 5-kinase [Oscillospiraceae bacterium]